VLKNVNPLLTGTLLRLMDEMGHGDVLGLVDRNFPAYRYRVPVIGLRGVDTGAASAALLSVFPVDSFVEDCIRRMQIDGKPDEITSATTALGAAARTAEGRDIEMIGVERFDFYEQAEQAMVIIQTGETIPYSCYLIKKGVV